MTEILLNRSFVGSVLPQCSLSLHVECIPSLKAYLSEGAVGLSVTMETCQSANHDQAKVLHNVTLRIHSQSFDCCTETMPSIYDDWSFSFLVCETDIFFFMVCENGHWSLNACSPLNDYFSEFTFPSKLSKTFSVYSSTVSLDCCHAITVQGDCIVQCDQCDHCGKNSSCLMPHTEPEKKIYIRVPLLHSVQGVEPGSDLDRTMGERVSLTVSSITSGGTCKVEISWSYGRAGM